MKKEESIRALEHLGLSTYEAKAYLAFLSESPLTGYRLSKISGVPRSRIYETIEKLIAKGLVLAQEGDTTLLKPVNFGTFLEKKEKERQQKIDFLKTNLPQIEKREEDHGIWNINGQDQLFEIVEHMISRAGSHIYIASYESDIIRCENALNKARGRNVSLSGVYCGENTLKFKSLHRHHGQTCSTCQDIALAVDSRQALVGSTLPADTARAALTENPGVVYIVEKYIKHEIVISEVFKTRDETSLESFNAIYREIVNKLP